MNFLLLFVNRFLLEFKPTIISSRFPIISMVSIFYPTKIQMTILFIGMDNRQVQTTVTKIILLWSIRPACTVTDPNLQTMAVVRVKTLELLFVSGHLSKERRLVDANSDLSSRLAPKTSHAPSWSTWVPKSQKKSDKRTWILIHIYVSGKILHSTTYMTRDQLRSLSTRTQQNRVYCQFSKVIMLLSSLMVKLAQVRLIPWKVSNTILEILSAVLFLDRWKKYSK